mmetsp:Transcript_10482/g.18682  ORF Transcript_10482/g.18682 Transcript_10482/m.18682 type:complete len:207 (+) Transcript_10482:881-1501(+)
MATIAFSTEAPLPEIVTERSPRCRSSLLISILAPVSRCSLEMVSPPRPMSAPIMESGTWIMRAPGGADLPPSRPESRLVSRFSRERPSTSSIMFLALSMPSGGPLTSTALSSGSSVGTSFWISMRTAQSKEIFLMVSPPFPMSMPINSFLTFTVIEVGLESSTSVLFSLSSSSSVFTLRPSLDFPSISSIIFLAYSTHSGGPVMWT